MWFRNITAHVPAMAAMLTPDGVPVIDALCRVLSDGGFSEFDALKASLESHPDARAAMRRDKPRPRRSRKGSAPAPEVPDAGEPASVQDGLWSE